MSIPSSILFTFHDSSKLYSVSARWLASIEVWEGNRVLDSEHVTAIRTTTAKAKDIQGPFAVVEYKEEGTEKPMRRLIDGQHRQAILREYFATESAEDFPVLVRRYWIADHDAAVHLFEQINRVKSIEYKTSPVARLHTFVDALRKEFVSESKKATSVVLIRNGCNRPYLSIENLSAAIKHYKLHERTDITCTDMIERAHKMNGFYAADPTRIPGRFTHPMLERATELGFYLGLDPTCTWLAGFCLLKSDGC
jgi:hypothetical protein